MPWEPGQSGNPQGSSRIAVIERALRAAVMRDDCKRLRSGIEKLMERVEAGDHAALDWVTCRLEGKARQSVEFGGNPVPIYDARQLAKEVAFILSAASATDAEIVSEVPTERAPALPAPEITAYDPDLADIKLTD